MNKLPAQKVDGLIDGMAVLQELASSGDSVSGLALANKLGLSPIRVNRLLKTFAYLGYAYQNSSRQYTVGPAIHVIAAQTMAASGLLGRALEYLELLNKDVRIVALGMLWDKKVCYLFHKEQAASLGEGISRVKLYDARKSSIGVALLAAMSDDAVLELYRGEDASELLDELRATRERGFALLRHDRHFSMAQTIGNPPYAALAASGFRDEAEIAPMAEKLNNYAALIEAKKIERAPA